VVAIGANAPTIIANNIFTATDNASSVFVHQNEEGGSSVHNNLFYESVGGFVSGRQTYSNVALLNARSWASDNLSGNPRIASIAGNNLSLTSDRSTAVEAASALPTAVPPSSVTQDPINGMIDCGADIDCINRNARDPKWNLAAYICDANLCVVDTILDEDGDGYPDWIEQIFGSDEFDVASWPPEYAVKEDFEGFSRPNGPDGEVPIRDVGAYEFEHPRE
jgi:hypothetical protein